MKLTALLLASLTVCTLHAAPFDENFTDGQDGQRPGGEWKTADNKDGITVEIGRPAGAPETEKWTRLVDQSTDQPANMRRSVGPVKAGTLSLRVHIVKLTPISIILGDGTASKPEERVVQIAINEKGKVKIQSAEPSVSSRNALAVGKSYTLNIEFAPEGDTNTSAKVVVKDGDTELETIEGVSPAQRPITALRITSQGEPTDGEFYVTAIKLDEK